MRISLDEAVAKSRLAGSAQLFPKKNDDARLRDGVIYSKVFPRFALTPGAAIFTLGSCFARSVEERLPGFSLPTKRVAVPKTERLGRPNGILNEYNPGTMCQRLECAARRETFSDLCAVADKDGYIDLLLPEYTQPSDMDRLMQRRAEVDEIYKALFTCEAIIITLDLVEAWYDASAKLFLNRIPPAACLTNERERYEVHIFDSQETYQLLRRMTVALNEIGLRKIIMTVSPVPLEATYSGRDCFAANFYSKSVLIASANEISREFAQVDYFPGFEIVMSRGANSYTASPIRVQEEIVEQVTAYMVESYVA